MDIDIINSRTISAPSLPFAALVSDDDSSGAELYWTPLISLKRRALVWTSSFLKITSSYIFKAETLAC